MISSHRVSSALLRSCQRWRTIGGNNNATTTSAPRAALSSSSSSSSSSPLAGDAGRKATHLHHRITTFLAFAVPAYLLVPDSYADTSIDKCLGIAISGSIAAHSWIGMNYVATDYVPKVSRALIGPTRVFNAALGIATFVGLGMIATNDRGGIRGALAGLWRPKTPPAIEEKERGRGM
ncbi:hypothetical protein ACHAXA_006361 [Cyclostephanos tholiformis]|uniref:Succinate dehydrogenase [ubiquinone] cytochrome b small subunit n=1 Tax=Cyclostephanos tholiformis TaxID=382380 RepID=A0ABD3RI95_9STRA